MKKIALVAHDGKKLELIQWINYSNNREKLAHYQLVGTATTAKQVLGSTGLPLEVLEPKEFASGPKGGDLLLAAEILKGSIDFLIFFIDPLDVHPHQNDIDSLVRACLIKNVPVALNKATADSLITSDILLEKK